MEDLCREPEDNQHTAKFLDLDQYVFVAPIPVPLLYSQSVHVVGSYHHKVPPSVSHASYVLVFKPHAVRPAPSLLRSLSFLTSLFTTHCGSLVLSPVRWLNSVSMV